MKFKPDLVKQLDYTGRKFNSCIRLAWQCVNDYKETKDKRYKQIRKEAMEDARYWKKLNETLINEAQQ